MGEWESERVEKQSGNELCSVQLLSHARLFETPWTVAHQVPLSMEFFRQECGSGFSFPTPGDFPSPGIEPSSLVSLALAGRFFTTVPLGKIVGISGGT